MDLLADALNVILVHRRAGKDECKVPASKVIGKVLDILKRESYIGDYKMVDDGKGGYFEIKGFGPINDCGVIKPRLQAFQRKARM